MESQFVSDEALALLRFVPEPILAFDRTLHVVVANDLACEFFQCSELDLRGLPFDRLFAKAPNDARERILRLARTGHIARLSDFVVTRFDGRDVRADIALRALRGASTFLLTIGNVRSSLGGGWIPRQVGEDGVAVTHGPFVARVDRNSVACVKDAEGIYLDVATSIPSFAPGREALLGRRDEQVWDPQLARFIEETDRLAFARPGTILRLEEREGLRVTRVYKTVLTDASGRRLLFLLHLDPKSAEEERQRLIDADQRHRAFLAGSSDLLLLTSEEGVVLDFHAGGDVRVLRDPADVIGSSFASLFPGEATADFERALATLRKTGEPQAVRFKLELEAGPHHYDARVVACGGRRVVLVVRDVTEREHARALETRLARAERLEAIGVLAGGVGHDFNNILAVVSSFAELLRQTDDLERARSFAGEIILAARRGRDLATELVAFARGGELKKRSTNLGSLVDEAARALAATHPDVAFAVEHPRSVSKVLGDPSQLYRVIANLAKNAADAVRERHGGKVTLTLEDRTLDREDDRTHVQPGRYVVLRVTDNGVGIDSATLSRIFDPFFTRKAEGHGTGLGLSVVHGIVRAHEGAVDVTSTVGSGTTFEVLLPAAESTLETTRSSAPANALGRLLLVEDDYNVGRSLALLLQSSGYHVEVVRSPVAALALITDGGLKVDLVITDLNMPELDGLELTQRLRAHAPTTPVILLSGQSPDLSTDELVEVGIEAVLSKPDALDEIEDTLQRLIAHRPS